MWKLETGEIWQARGKEEKTLPKKSKLALYAVHNRNKGTEGNSKPCLVSCEFDRKKAFTHLLPFQGAYSVFNVLSLH